MTERLTTLAAVKSWLLITTDQNDEFLIRVIDAVSRFILNYLSLDTFGPSDYTQNFRGNGKSSQLLKYWPVISVSSVGIAGTSIPASPIGNYGLPGSGFTISDRRNSQQSIDLWGSVYAYGAPSQIVYRAGYGSTQYFTITADNLSFTPMRDGQWTYDLSVKMNGTDMIKVEEDPQSGEYTLDMWGLHIFSAADIGQQVEVIYAYVPSDISFAISTMVGEWVKLKDRIGLNSKSLTGGVGESVTFSTGDFNDLTRMVLQPYMNVVPM